MGKLLLVDGNSILNRGFYGIPPLKDSHGIYTNAILGFLNILLRVLSDEKPDYLTVAFDVKAPTFRHEMFPEYKGTRKPMPEELKVQLPIIREVLASMKVNVVEMAGYEADDLLGTLAKKGEKDGHIVTLLSGDRDLLQIASDNIKISIPKTKGDKTETFSYHTKDVIDEYGVTPIEFIDVKALQGDTSDNIPGVPKVGPKTASELIAKYHDLESLYDHIEEITKKGLYSNLTEYKEQAFLSRDLARINIESPVSIDYDKCLAKGMLNEDSMKVFLYYSLKSIITKLETFEESDSSVSVSETKQVEYTVIEDFNETNDLIASLAKLKTIGLYSDNDNGVSITTKDNTYYIRYFGFITKDYIKDSIKPLVKTGLNVVTYKIKDSYSLFENYSDNLDDIEILAYLLDPTKGDYPVSNIAVDYMNAFYGETKELVSDKERYAATVSKLSYDLLPILSKKVTELDMLSLYRNIEMPLSYVLYSMEQEGVLVKKEALLEYSSKLKSSISELEKTIHEEAGVNFNINSPKQLGEVLFETLGLKGGKKTKSGYSTAADVLEKLAPENKIVRDVLEYRALSKLNSTYAEGLQNFIADDGRIHTHFNQTITATGRISSTEPNLQNIPIRTEMGREFRRIFVPKAGYTFIDADYSQIELRLMAHMSGDEKLINAYKENKDIHRSTASLVFNVPFDEVTSDLRRNAKAVNFGIIYGISSFGLANDIGCNNSTAKKYIEDYFNTYTDIKKYLDDTVANAKETGFTKTLYGRIRPIPEIKAPNFMTRSFGERVAMNAPIQGTAADIMKIAMINIFNRLNELGLKSKLLLQVHDEVLIEAADEEVDTVLNLVRDEMSKAAELLVPLEAEANKGASWYEAH